MKETKYCPYCRADITPRHESCIKCGKPIPKIPVVEEVAIEADEVSDGPQELTVKQSEPITTKEAAKRSFKELWVSLVVVVAVTAVYGLMYAFRDKSVAAAAINAKTTPDLSMLHLKGPVKSVVVKRKKKDEAEWWVEATYTFDEQGRLTSYPGWPEPYTISYATAEGGVVTLDGGAFVKRDAQGRITALEVEDKDWGFRCVEWDYTADNVSEVVDGYYTTTHVVARTNGGLPRIVDSEQTCRGMTDNWKWEYTYTDFDDYGNYIKATYSETHDVDYGDIFADMQREDDTPVEEPEPERVEEMREITYYDDGTAAITN